MLHQSKLFMAAMATTISVCASAQVTTVYTLIDIDSLRACALEVPELSSPAYGYRGL